MSFGATALAGEPSTFIEYRRRLLAAFALLSLLDFLLTWWLIERTGGIVYEANPIAASILSQHGWWGLSGYKLACTGLFLGLGLLIGYLRPRTGRRLLVVGCGLLLAVVGYGTYLLLAQPWDPVAQRDLDEARERRVRLERECQEVRAYGAEVDRLSMALLSERVTLAEATSQLEAQLATIKYNPLPFLRGQYAGLSDRACLTAALIRNVAALLEDPLGRQCHARRLARDFETLYHCPVPTVILGASGPGAVRLKVGVDRKPAPVRQ